MSELLSGFGATTTATGPDTAASHGPVAQLGAFCVVGAAGCAVNLAFLALLHPLLNSLAAQRPAISLATPLNFLGNTLWSFAEAP